MSASIEIEQKATEQHIKKLNENAVKLVGALAHLVERFHGNTKLGHIL